MRERRREGHGAHHRRRPRREHPPDVSGRLAARLERARWPRPAIFDWLQRAGNVADAEMHRVFNCGIGMVVVVAARGCRTRGRDCSRTPASRLPDRHRRAARGRRARHRRRLARRDRHRAPAVAIPRITVLISGRGSNLAALLAAERDGRLGGTIAAVISNRAGDRRPRLAAAHGVAAHVVEHRPYADARRTSTPRSPRRSTRASPISSCSPASCASSGRRSSRATRAGCSTSIRRCCRRIRGCTRIAARWPTACASTAAPCTS